MQKRLQQRAAAVRWMPSVSASSRGLLQRKCACGGTPGPTGECEECRKKRLQREIRNSKPEIRNDVHVPIVPDAVRSLGQSRIPARRDFIDSDFGHDFSHVRVRPAAIASASMNVPKGPSGTDDLTETDLSVPRAEGDAGAPEPTCCDKAFTKGLAGGDYGGVICCKNVKYSCVWPSNMSSALTNAKARSISIDCARVHEDTHHDDIDCTGAEVERPGFKAGKNAKAEECTAYKTEVACFDSHLADCGDDAECKKQIRDRRGVKQGQADSNCA
jgi:hypothetical protein